MRMSFKVYNLINTNEFRPINDNNNLSLQCLRTTIGRQKEMSKIASTFDMSTLPTMHKQCTVRLHLNTVPSDI